MFAQNRILSFIPNVLLVLKGTLPVANSSKLETISSPSFPVCTKVTLSVLPEISSDSTTAI